MTYYQQPQGYYPQQQYQPGAPSPPAPPPHNPPPHPVAPPASPPARETATDTTITYEQLVELLPRVIEAYVSYRDQQDAAAAASEASPEPVLEAPPPAQPPPPPPAPPVAAAPAPDNEPRLEDKLQLADAANRQQQPAWLSTPTPQPTNIGWRSPEIYAQQQEDAVVTSRWYDSISPSWTTAQVEE